VAGPLDACNGKGRRRANRRSGRFVDRANSSSRRFGKQPNASSGCFVDGANAILCSLGKRTSASSVRSQEASSSCAGKKDPETAAVVIQTRNYPTYPSSPCSAGSSPSRSSAASTRSGVIHPTTFQIAMVITTA
jgi:hypothetical protein